MQIAISQPRYLPAINYLQRIHYSDVFVILDNVQRQGRGVENRNKILMNGIEKLLTVPVASSSREIIRTTLINGSDWMKQHKEALHNAYKNHPHYSSDFIDLYFGNIEHILQETGFNYSLCFTELVKNCCGLFRLNYHFRKASEFTTDEQTGPGKLLDICKALETTTYISGANGKEYGIEETFKESNIKIVYHEFSFPVYAQHKAAAFVPWTCFFDMLFNLGLDKTTEIIKSPIQLIGASA